MRKIPTLFVRDEKNPARVTDKIVPGLEWVLEKGVATVKWDGTAVRILDNGAVMKRFDAKHGKPVPLLFEPADPAPDPVTGHWPGWVPVDPGRPEDRWVMEAVGAMERLIPGTYELLGPKVQGNPQGLARHELIRHGAKRIVDPLRTFAECRVFLVAWPYEGIVWWDQEGPVAKLKRRDFGYPWPTGDVRPDGARLRKEGSDG